MFKAQARIRTNPLFVAKNEDDDSMQEDTNIETMSSILSSVCLTEEIADVYFGFPNDRSTRIPAHKTLLSLRSPVFKAMFYGSFPRTDKDIIIDDVTEPIFKAFIRYLYTDEAVFDKDNVMFLMNVAKKYQVMPLLSKCGSYLSKNLNTTNACTIYRHARFFVLKDLVAKSLGFIQLNAYNVFMDDDFLSISIDDLSEILKSEKLEIAEVDIFKSILRWADGKLTKAKRTINSKSRREVLLQGNILYLIAVPTFSMKDYTHIVIPTGILSDEEQLQVFKAITINGPNKPATKFDKSPRIKKGKTRILTVDEILSGRQLQANDHFRWNCTGNSYEVIGIQASKKTILKSVTVFPNFTRSNSWQNNTWHLHWNTLSDFDSSTENCVDLFLNEKQKRINIDITLEENCKTSIKFQLYTIHQMTVGSMGCPLQANNHFMNPQAGFPRPNQAFYQMQQNYGRPQTRASTLLGQNELIFSFEGSHLVHDFEFECE